MVPLPRIAAECRNLVVFFFWVVGGVTIFFAPNARGTLRYDISGSTGRMFRYGEGSGYNSRALTC
jgi:hypothetical protein